MAETRLYCKTHDSLFKHPQVFCDRYDRLHDEMGNEPAFRCVCETIVKLLREELVDTAQVDYDAATRVMRSWLVEDNDARLLSAVRLAVDAALGVGEPPD